MEDGKIKTERETDRRTDKQTETYGNKRNFGKKNIS